MSSNENKIYTLEYEILKINQNLENPVMIPLNWSANYKIKESKRNDKKILSCELAIDGFSPVKYKSDDKHSFKIGDISNDFFQAVPIFNCKNASTYTEKTFQSQINITNLNKFIVKYHFPPFSIEKTISSKNQVIIQTAEQLGITDNNKITKEKILYFPFENNIEKYIESILKFNTENKFVSPVFTQFQCNIKLFQQKTENKTGITATSDSMNNIISFDMLNALSHYKLKYCESCGILFFANRGNHQEYCNECKNKPKQNLLSQNTARNSFIRKLNRKYPTETIEFKNQLLIENGFEPLKK